MKGTFLGRLFNQLRHYSAVLLQQGRVQLDADTKDQFFGIYRGIVTSNIDPENLMRIQVTVPDVLSSKQTPFAQPCLPAVTPQVTIPAIGASVWIMFEGGDPNQPVWMGNLKGQS